MLIEMISNGKLSPWGSPTSQSCSLWIDACF
jgi:hypothetical protein